MENELKVLGTEHICNIFSIIFTYIAKKKGEKQCN